VIFESNSSQDEKNILEQVVKLAKKGGILVLSLCGLSRLQNMTGSGMKK
jgi:16S rRNA C967 or C1407 C5-methylase (RsmB/RsmF family)